MKAERVKTPLAVVAGAALPLAFAPFGAYWLAPICYAALFYAWRDATPRLAFRRGWLFGFASFLTGVYWIYISVHEFGQAPMALALALMLGLVVIMGVYTGAVGWAAARWLGTSGVTAWLVGLPAAWTLVEWLRGWLFTGFGWLSAGYSQTDSWLMAYAPIAGVHGMSWAVLVAAGALLGLVLARPPGRAASGAVLFVVVGAAFALDDRDWTVPKDNALTVALAQGAVPQDQKWLEEQLPATLALYRGLTEQAHGAELIVWPEAAVPHYYEAMQRYLSEIETAAAGHGSAVMLGILRIHEPTRTPQNALYLLGNPDTVYVKRHLVPYGEYFPVPDFVRAWMRAMELPNIDVVAGDPDQPLLDLDGERIAVTICYEDVFGAEQLHFLPEATLLVNVSNDAWFGDSIAPHQHLQIARVRAAEAGRFMLRSTNTGVTAIIDPHGGVEATLPQFEPGVLEGTVRGYTGATPYARFGNYPVVTAVLIALIALGARRARPGSRARP